MEKSIQTTQTAAQLKSQPKKPSVDVTQNWRMRIRKGKDGEMCANELKFCKAVVPDLKDI